MHDWGNSKMYRVECTCTNEDDSIVFEVEASDHEITVTHYTTQKTDWWTEYVAPRYDIDNAWLQEFNWFWTNLLNGLVTRLRLTRDIWFHGYAKYQCTTMMTEQQALNYAETLKSAMIDCREFHKEREWQANVQNRIAKRLAEESDCV